MAAIHDLLAQVQDIALRDRLEQEINRMSKSKKFGLVFEEHLPECTPLYDIPVKRGSTVAKRAGSVSEMYEVRSIKDGTATCLHKVKKELEEIPVDELVCVAEFGEPIYPYLKPIDSVCNAPDNDAWHTLIEADNYHALQLLEYLYSGKVDCIYIDPPYNTGAKDWKYNNNYVDSNDAYRHSKWLSFMEKRLRIAKKLLNPKDSVLIVTIDEKEYLHLGCLLEELFPEARIQMLSMIINRRGAIRTGDFSRTNEFVFCVMIGDSKPGLIYSEEGMRDDVKWVQLRRSDLSSKRGTSKGGPAQFYPIYVNNITKRIVKVGDPLPHNVDRNTAENIDGCSTVFPVRSDGTEMNWGLIGPELEARAKKGYVKVGSYNAASPQQYAISYLTSSYIDDIESGRAKIIGYSDSGNVICKYVEVRGIYPTTQWDKNTHDAKTFGTDVIDKIIGKNKFTFPKSIYSVKDVLELFIKDNKKAMVIDFFAGSGTTLHAVNMLNAEDNGFRRCIMVTNNEVSDAEAKSMAKKGLKPGDAEWEKYGIARHVTWPRTVCSIEGHDINGKPLKGNYVGSERPMADGFEANVEFFKLGFLDKTEVSLGMQLKELLPLLWMKAGAIHQCPVDMEENAGVLIYPENKFAVLIDERKYMDFISVLEEIPEIRTIFFVTDSDAGYRDMISGLEDKETYQLYKDYLDNFRINATRR